MTYWILIIPILTASSIKFNSSDTETPFLDLYLTISDGFVSSKIYDQRDDFGFDIVNFPFLDGDIPRGTSYGVYISRLIRFSSVSSHVADLITRNKILTANFSNKAISITNCVFFFQNSVDVTMIWYPNLMLDSNRFLNKACRNSNFMMTYCIHLDGMILSDPFRKIIIRYKNWIQRECYARDCMVGG